MNRKMRLFGRSHPVFIYFFIGLLLAGLILLWVLLGRSDQTDDEIKPIENVNEAVVYYDIIQPILATKCVSCHGTEKQKGKLRLDGKEFIMKGGKNGEAVVGGDVGQSEMMNRILLPPDDEDHMPPKEKGQLTDHQVALIRWWIDKGADFEKKVKDLSPDQHMQPALASLKGSAEKPVLRKKGLPQVKPADTAILSSLRKAGVLVVPVSQESNFLSVNLINCTRMSDTVWSGLVGIADQLIWLKADGPLVNDEMIPYIVKCRNLKRLSLANSLVTEKSIDLLKQCGSLEYLNLFGTNIQHQ